MVATGYVPCDVTLKMSITTNQLFNVKQRKEDETNRLCTNRVLSLFSTTDNESIIIIINNYDDQ